MRSVWKGSYWKSQNDTILRSSVILNTMFKKKFTVHDGKALKNITINRFMLGLKIGQFVFNRKLGSIHKKKKNDKRKKKK